MGLKKWMLFTCLLLSCFICNAQSIKNLDVVLHGTATDYSGMDLTFQTIKNPITSEYQDLTTVRVDKEGHFKHVFKLEKVTYAILDLGRFRTHAYFEPGKSYELILPPFEPRSDADRFNPFFKPEDVVLGIANAEGLILNKQIAEFESAFTDLYNQKAVSIFRQNDQKAVDALIHELDSLYPSNANSYFANVKHFHYAKLHFLTHKRQQRRLIQECFSNQKPEMDMPAFSETFNQVFNSFFSQYFKSNYGQQLRDVYTTTSSFDSLSLVMSSDTLFENVEFRELVLLKALYDAFYSGTYNKEKLIKLIADAAHTASSEKLKNIAEDVHRKMTWLRNGTEAPLFDLYRLDGKERSLIKYRGKFVYLHFLHSQNHACKEDLQRLKAIYDNVKRDVVFLTVIMDEDPTEIKEYVKENKLKWDFLHFAAQPKVYFDYNLKALPTYYLIDPEGNLRLSPAPGPGEKFVEIFYTNYRDYKHDQLRKSRPKAKSIYDM